MRRSLNSAAQFAILLLCGLLAACNLQSSPNTPPPTPDIPTVQFQFPPNNSSVIEGVDLTIELVAQDGGAGVSRVELLIDDQPHQEAKPEVNITVPTFTVTMNWLAQGLGSHSLTAIAYRTDGTASDAEVIIVDVVAKQQE